MIRKHLTDVLDETKTQALITPVLITVRHFLLFHELFFNKWCKKVLKLYKMVIANLGRSN